MNGSSIELISVHLNNSTAYIQALHSIRSADSRSSYMRLNKSDVIVLQTFFIGSAM